MFEGKHIHFSPTDNKPLCSYSGKVCRQRRLNGYAFCIRHILEDKSAPFKQCSYVTRNNSQKCLNAIPTNQDRGYCHSHMQVVGMIPKTERKSKVHPVSKADNNNSSGPVDKSLSSAVTNSSTKKDPGAVFKFEEDSSDVTDFSYKNGLSTGSLNGKGKASKLRETSYNSSPKDIKNVKTQNGFTGNFTTKKITDKNKNVYTTIIPTSNCTINNANKVPHLKNKNTFWSNATTDATSSAGGGSRTPKPSTRLIESELNKLHDQEEIRQFEQLKTLKQLDNSLLQSQESIGLFQDGNGADAKLQVFPRLALSTNKTINSTSSIRESSSTPMSSSPVTNHPAPDDLTSQSSTESYSKSEIVSTSPSPPLITRSNNSIIIKTEPKNEAGMDNATHKSESIEKQHISSDRGVLFTSGKNNNYINTVNSSNDHCNSIDKDLKSRHEFLAHVRLSFKSQYKSIKKACKFSESCDKSGKQKLRDSLMRCVRIDSSICAQVLLGDGSKLPTLLYSPIKIEVEGKPELGRKQEFDDYDFVDNEGSLPFMKNDTANSEQKFKKGKGSNKPNPNKTTQKRSVKKGKEVELFGEPNKATENLEKNDKEKMLLETLKESKLKVVSSAAATTKRKLKRADAIHVSPENSLGNVVVQLNESFVSLNNNNTERADGSSIVKKRRLGLNMTALETDLGLSMNDQSSPSQDESNPPSAHKNLNQSVGHDAHRELRDILGHSQLSSSVSSHRNQGLETVLNSVGSSENAGTPDGVITDASFDSTFEHSTSSHPDCEFSEDDLEHSFELQIDPEIESQASRLLEDNVLTEADFTELFPDNRMSDHKFGRNDLQELGMTGLEFDVNDIDYSLFANIFPNFPRSSQPESISISNQF